MKPRIVRETGWFDANVPMAWANPTGAPWLALPWPTECPYGPEAVMAACERAGLVPIGIPTVRDEGGWCIPYAWGMWRGLTPEFMAEPKCEHGLVAKTGSSTMDYGEPRHYCKCLHCGAILSDRRKGERRKGERRTTSRRWADVFMSGKGSRRKDRRTGTDRRRPHDN